MKEYRIRRRVVKENDVILTRQSTQIFFKNGDTDFFFNWLLGIGEIFGFSLLHNLNYVINYDFGKGCGMYGK